MVVELTELSNAGSSLSLPPLRRFVDEDDTLLVERGRAFRSLCRRFVDAGEDENDDEDDDAVDTGDEGGLDEYPEPLQDRWVFKSEKWWGGLEWCSGGRCALGPVDLKLGCRTSSSLSLSLLISEDTSPSLLLAGCCCWLVLRVECKGGVRRRSVLPRVLDLFPPSASSVFAEGRLEVDRGLLVNVDLASSDRLGDGGTCKPHHDRIGE